MPYDTILVTVESTIKCHLLVKFATFDCKIYKLVLLSRLFLIIILNSLIYFPVNSQGKSEIDSINSLGFEYKVANTIKLEDIYLKNAAHARRLKYRIGEADSYSNLGLIYYYQGKYSLNVNYILKAIGIYDELGLKEKQAYEYGELGYSMKRRNLSKALYYMQKGKSISESHKLTKPLLSIYNNYGVLKEMMADNDSALYFYRKGLELKQRVGDSTGIPYSLNNIAGMYVMQKKLKEAENLYDQALKIRLAKNDHIGIAENFTYFGDLERAKGDHRRAIRYYKKSLEKARQHQYTYLIQNNYKSLSECYEKLNETADAYRNFKLHAQFKDSLLDRETNAKIAELEIRFETSRKERQLAQNRIALLQKDAEVQTRSNLLAGAIFIAGFISVTGFLVFRQQRLKHQQLRQEHQLRSAMAVIETQNKLQDQRQAISRDLHDNIGAQLSFIISSVDNVLYASDIREKALGKKLENVSSFARETIVELRDTIWAMNSSEISLEELKGRILNFIEKARSAHSQANLIFESDENLPDLRLTSIQGMNLYRSVQEAINNALKYSDAKDISISMFSCGNGVEIKVCDTGKGYDAKLVSFGNGIRNMKKRMGDIDAEFCIESTPGTGTQVLFKLLNLIGDDSDSNS